MLLFFFSHAQAGPLHGSGSSDASTYEAITGDSADEDRSVWDSFYKSNPHSAGKDPVSFLKDNVSVIPKGRAFVPAMGEGRNAIYLAKKGFTVDGVDISEVAVDRATKDAKDQHVTLKGITADLNEYKYPENYYDCVVVSLFYLSDLIPKFRKTLKPGGYILLYLKLDMGKLTKKKSPDDFLVKEQELKNSLKGFDIKVYRKYKDQDEDVIGILARRS